VNALKIEPPPYAPPGESAGLLLCGRRTASAPFRASLVTTGASFGTSLVTTGAPLLTPLHPDCLCVSIRRRKHHWWGSKAHRDR
jgi:hypothetical protein